MLCKHCNIEHLVGEFFNKNWICSDCQDILLGIVGLMKLGEVDNMVILGKTTFEFPKFDGKLRDVYEKVCSNPGSSLTKLSKLTEINMAQLSYYCRALEDLGVLHYVPGAGMSKKVYILGVVNVKR